MHRGVEECTLPFAPPLTMKAATRFSLRLISLWLNLIPPPVSDARALRTGAGFHCEDEGRKGEGCGRPISKVRLMATPYRPRPENLCPEESLSEAP